jgi:hypothetical protein
MRNIDSVNKSVRKEVNLKKSPGFAGGFAKAIPDKIISKQDS